MSTNPTINKHRILVSFHDNFSFFFTYQLTLFTMARVPQLLSICGHDVSKPDALSYILAAWYASLAMMLSFFLSVKVARIGVKNIKIKKGNEMKGRSGRRKRKRKRQRLRENQQINQVKQSKVCQKHYDNHNIKPTYQ